VDHLDLGIIRCLEEDGRGTNTVIAQMLGVTESTVRKRVDRLLRDGVIRITAVANPLTLGYEIVAIFGIRVVPSSIPEAGTALQNMPEFRFIGQTTGEFDFVAEAWFKSLQDLRAFIGTRLAQVGGVTRVDTSHVLEMLRYTYDWGRDVSRPYPEAIKPSLPVNAARPSSGAGVNKG
jgi:Lrp/AsnC family transcriptional regulator for asnA, asnC and gidA